MLGSGHPDTLGKLPNFLGLIRSTDGGKTWSVVARLADADLHKIVLRHNRLYAFDAVLSAMLTSSDGGKTFTEEFTPRGLMIDFEVDPADPERIVASTDTELFRTEDGGKSWRPLTKADGIRLGLAGADVALPRRQGRHDPGLGQRRHAPGGTSGTSAASRTSCAPPVRRRCSSC